MKIAALVLLCRLGGLRVSVKLIRGFIALTDINNIFLKKVMLKKRGGSEILRGNR